VGIFSAGYKIIQIFVLLISLITTTVFPHIVKLVSESNDDIKLKVNRFIKKVLLIIILVGVLSFLFLFIFADFIANLLFVAEYNDTIKVIRILSLAPLLIGIGHTLTLQVLVPLEYDSLVAKIYGFSAIVDVILCFILIPLYGYIGLCIAILATRFITIIFSIVGIKRNDVKLNLLNLQKQKL
jgi:PST family polysaccharide transporter